MPDNNPNEPYLSKIAREKASEFGITGKGHNDTLDAFRHTYISAMFAYYAGNGIAHGFGELNELKGDIWNGQPISERHMDEHNNEVGRKIGQNATNHEDIGKHVYDALARGELIINDTDNGPSSPFDNDADYTPPIGVSHFVASDTSPRMGSFDPSSVFRALGGGKSRMSSKQIFAMSAASFAQEIIKSNRRRMENDLIDILTGGNSKTGMPQVASGNPVASLTNSLGGLIDNLVGSAMSRRKTRVSTSESERSVEASRNWNPSRSQQQAMLASWAQQGNRNL